jgi:hypothetical protein
MVIFSHLTILSSPFPKSPKEELKSGSKSAGENETCSGITKMSPNLFPTVHRCKKNNLTHFSLLKLRQTHVGGWEEERNSGMN